MDIEQIKQHFGDALIYKFIGTASELSEIQISNNSSYNYIQVNGDTFYYISDYEISDPRVTVFVDNRKQ
jgi:hypothetical protein